MAVAQQVAREDAQLVALRVPPHSVEAEQSLIGALLLDNQAFDRVADVVTAEDFYRDDHRRIFRHVSRLIEHRIRDPRAWIWRASFRMAAGELEARRGISPQGGTLAAGVFVVPVHVLDGSKYVIGTDVFTVGPGTASDGRVGQLVITDVQPA